MNEISIAEDIVVDKTAQKLVGLYRTHYEVAKVFEKETGIPIGLSTIRKIHQGKGPFWITKFVSHILKNLE